jgi:hypothetical protein
MVWPFVMESYSTSNKSVLILVDRMKRKTGKPKVTLVQVVKKKKRNRHNRECDFKWNRTVEKNTHDWPRLFYGKLKHLNLNG